MQGWIISDGSDHDEEIGVLIESSKSIFGDVLRVVSTADVLYVVETGLPAKLWLNNKPCRPPDFFTILGNINGLVVALANQLEKLGCLSYNRIEAKRTSVSKMATNQILAKEGIAVAKTMLIHKDTPVELIIDNIGLPCVIKPDKGYGGIGVELVHSREELEKNVAGIDNSDDFILAQEYIATSFGKDLRIRMINNKPIAALLRESGKADEFRSNRHMGGRMTPVEITDEIRVLADKVSRIIGLDIGGLDFLFGENGFVVGEVNSAPGGFNSKEMVSSLFKDIKSRLLGHPLPYWKETEIFSESETEPFGAALLKLDNMDFYKAQKTIYANCEKVQSTVLLEIVNRCRNTEFGRKYGFDNIKTVDEYRDKLPLSTWDDYKDYSKRMQKGEGDLTFDGKAEFFYRTSGTSADFKLIPESASEKTARKAIVKTRIMYKTQIVKLDMITKVLLFPNEASIGKTEAGIPYGSASGHTVEDLPEEIAKLMAFPASICNEFKGDALNYVMLRCSLMHKQVSGVLGNNALRFIQLAEYGAANAQDLIDDIEKGTCKFKGSESLSKELESYLKPDIERAGFLRKLHNDNKFYPGYYWEGLELAGFWLGGTVGAYIEEARKYLPDNIKFMDVGYGASEVKINIALTHSTPAGVLSTFNGFFEFIPEDGGQPLLAHELEDKKRYELVVTTYSGLYRYCMHDLVQVDGFTGNTPNIFFVAKLGDVGNMAQEKIPGAVIDASVRGTAEKFGVSVKALQAVTDTKNLRYTICVEMAEPEKIDKETFEAAVEEGLRRDIANYERYRDLRALNPSNVVLMKNGWRNELLIKYTKGNASAAQVKIPVIASAVDEKWIL